MSYPDKRRNSNGLTAAQQHVLDNIPSSHPRTMEELIALTPTTPAISERSRRSTIRNVVSTLVYYKHLVAQVSHDTKVTFYKPTLS